MSTLDETTRSLELTLRRDETLMISKCDSRDPGDYPRLGQMETRRQILGQTKKDTQSIGYRFEHHRTSLLVLFHPREIGRRRIYQLGR